MTKSLDRYRADAAERTTQRIKRALSKLRADLPLFKRKPTKKDLARLAGVHVNTLDLRSRVLADQVGLSNPPAKRSRSIGWPISELKALQLEWREFSTGKQFPPEGHQSTVAGNGKTEEQFNLEAYKRQNIDLLYRNEELTYENRSLHSINDNLKREIELVSGENARPTR